MYKILLPFIFTISSFAMSCPKSYSAEKVAKELIRLEFSGVRADGMEEHECLKQNRHPNILVVHDASNEQSLGAEFEIANGVQPKIESIVLTDKRLRIYNVEYSVQAKELKSGKTITYRDKITYRKYINEKNISFRGCGAILEAPEKIAIFKECNDQ